MLSLCIKMYSREEVPSANLLYAAGTKYNSNKTWWYKLDHVKKFQNNLIFKLNRANLGDLFKPEDYPNLSVHMVFLMTGSYNSRDVTNCVKATEDALHKVLKVDDSKTIKFTAEKYRAPGLCEWVLIYIKDTSSERIDVSDHYHHEDEDDCVVSLFRAIRDKTYESEEHTESIEVNR